MVLTFKELPVWWEGWKYTLPIHLTYCNMWVWEIPPPRYTQDSMGAQKTGMLPVEHSCQGWYRKGLTEMVVPELHLNP